MGGGATNHVRPELQRCPAGAARCAGELQLCAGGATKVRHRSCKRRPKLQWCATGAAKVRLRSCNGAPPELQATAEPSMVRHQSCKAAPLELRPVNVAVVGAASMLQASVKLRGGVASPPTSAPLPCCQPSGCHRWCCKVPMLHRRVEVLPTGVDASPVRSMRRWRGPCVGG